MIYGKDPGKIIDLYEAVQEFRDLDNVANEQHIRKIQEVTVSI